MSSSRQSALMAQVKSTTVLVLVTSLTCLLGVSIQVLQEKTAKPGDDVTLRCQRPISDPSITVEWTRSDLKPLEYVYLYRDGHSNDPSHQHPSFKNRVELRDAEMKNGDLTLTLKKVTEDDRGTYECRIVEDGARRRKRSFIPSEPICSVDLKVLDPGELSLSSLTPQQSEETEDFLPDAYLPDRPGMDQQDHEDPDPEGPAGRGHAAVGVVTVLFIAAVIAVIVRVRKHEAQNNTDLNPV